MSDRQQGFTLIELLVVISIISLLSSVVLSSLNASRTKANDASVKQSLEGARKQAVISYSESAGYANICSDATMVRLLASAQRSGGATSVDSIYGDLTDPTRVTCRANATGYMIVAPFKAPTSNAWCIDSTGNAKQETNNYTAMNTPNTLVVCP